MLSPPALAAVLLVVTGGHLAASHPSFASRIPNGDYVTYADKPWPGVGHDAPYYNGSLYLLNPFGEDFKAEGLRWTTALCEKDSDHDGYTNGEELGDPDCTWYEGQTPSREPLGHPGKRDVRAVLCNAHCFATGTCKCGQNHTCRNYDDYYHCVHTAIQERTCLPGCSHPQCPRCPSNHSCVYSGALSTELGFMVYVCREGGLEPVAVCTDGQQPDLTCEGSVRVDLSQTDDRTVTIRYSKSTAITMLFKKKIVTKTEEKGVSHVSPIPESACGSDGLVDCDSMYCNQKDCNGCCTPDYCKDDMYGLLENANWNCEELVKELGCHGRISDISPMVPPVKVVTLCQRRCKSCYDETRPLNLGGCSRCKDDDEPVEEICGSNMWTYRSRCEFERAQCIWRLFRTLDRSEHILPDLKEAHLGSCDLPVTGVINKIDHEESTLEVQLPKGTLKYMCLNNVLPVLRCPNGNPPRYTTKIIQCQNGGDAYCEDGSHTLPCANNRLPLCKDGTTIEARGHHTLAASSNQHHALAIDMVIGGYGRSFGGNIVSLNSTLQQRNGYGTRKVSEIDFSEGQEVMFSTRRGDNMATSILILRSALKVNSSYLTQTIEGKIIAVEVAPKVNDDVVNSKISILVHINGWTVQVTQNTRVSDAKESPLSIDGIKASLNAYIECVPLGSSMMALALTMVVGSEREVQNYMRQYAEAPVTFPGICPAGSNEAWCTFSDSCERLKHGRCNHTVCSNGLIYCKGVGGKGCYDPNDCNETDVWGTLEEMVNCRKTHNDGLCYVKVHGQQFRVRPDAKVATNNGWSVPLKGLEEGMGVRLRVVQPPSEDDVKMVVAQLTLLASSSSQTDGCRDDPDGFLEGLGRECEDFIALGCSEELNVPREDGKSTVLRDLCPFSCEICGLRQGASDGDAWSCSREGLDICIRNITEYGCPSDNRAWEVDGQNCSNFRFCHELAKAVEKLCPPDASCRSAWDKAASDGIEGPTCEPGGMRWLRKQCNSQSCWCVDPSTGSKIPGTTRQGTGTVTDLDHCEDQVYPVPWCNAAQQSCSEECQIPRCPWGHVCAKPTTELCCDYTCEEEEDIVPVSSITRLREVWHRVTLGQIVVHCDASHSFQQMEGRLEGLKEDLSKGLNISVILLRDSMATRESVTVRFRPEPLDNIHFPQPDDVLAFRARQIEEKHKYLVAKAFQIIERNPRDLKITRPPMIIEEVRPAFVGWRMPRKMKAVADFGEAGKVVFEATEASPTVITIDLTLPRMGTYAWRVEGNSKVSGQVTPDRTIWNGADPVYNPNSVVSPSPNECDPRVERRFEKCKVGDLVGKHGSLTQRLVARQEDRTLPLFGWSSVLGRPLVIDTTPPLRATIREVEAETTVLMAVFGNSGPLMGSVTLTQSANSDVMVSISLQLVTSGKERSGYGVHIHSQLATSCDWPGPVAKNKHYDPYPPCIPHRAASAGNCQPGDLTAKFGRIPIPFQGMFTDSTMDLADIMNLETAGDSPVGNIVITSPEGTKLDCAPLYPSGVMGDHSSESKEPSNLVRVIIACAVVGIIAIALFYNFSIRKRRDYTLQAHDHDQEDRKHAETASFPNPIQYELGVITPVSTESEDAVHRVAVLSDVDPELQPDTPETSTDQP